MRLFKGWKGWVSGIPLFFRYLTTFKYIAFVFCPMGRPTQEASGSQKEPSERTLSPTASLAQEERSRRIVGNHGLAIRSFRTMAPLDDKVKEGLERNFRITITYMREGDPNRAIIGMRKFSMLMHELDERQLWHGLETLKRISSNSERGNELRYHASEMLNLVESELWVRLGGLAEAGMDKGADPQVRANAFTMIAWLYPRLIRQLAERTKPNAIVGDAEEDGKAGASLPAWNASAVRIAMEDAAKQHSARMSEEAHEVEKKMAYSILTVVFEDNEVDRRVYEAAFYAFENIDSPIMSNMLTKDMQGFELRGTSGNVFSGETARRASPAPESEHPIEFEEQDFQMRIERE